jgi:hypothetical protein
VRLLAGDVFGLVEDVGVEGLRGVEDFDADEAASFLRPAHLDSIDRAYELICAPEVA